MRTYHSELDLFRRYFMNLSQTLLTDLKAKHGGLSDYKAAKLIGVSQQAVSRVSANGKQFSDENAVKIAQMLGLSSVYVLAKLHIEIEKSDSVKEVWEEILDQQKKLQAIEVEKENPALSA